MNPRYYLFNFLILTFSSLLLAQSNGAFYGSNNILYPGDKDSTKVWNFVNSADYDVVTSGNASIAFNGQQIVYAATPADSDIVPMITLKPGLGQENLQIKQIVEFPVCCYSNYSISNDNGTTWYYWNGSWNVADGT